MRALRTVATSSRRSASICGGRRAPGRRAGPRRRTRAGSAGRSACTVELRAVARVHACSGRRRAPGAPGSAATGRGVVDVPQDGRQGAGAVGQDAASGSRAPSRLRRVSRLADHEHLVDGLAVFELPHEHAREDRAGERTSSACPCNVGRVRKTSPDMAGTALVTGGTGGLGTAVVERFLDGRLARRRAVGRRDGAGATAGTRRPGAGPGRPVRRRRRWPSAVEAAAAQPGAPLGAVVNLVGGFSAPGARARDADRGLRDTSSGSTCARRTCARRPPART